MLIHTLHVQVNIMRIYKQFKLFKHYQLKIVCPYQTRGSWTGCERSTGVHFPSIDNSYLLHIWWMLNLYIVIFNFDNLQNRLISISAYNYKFKVRCWNRIWDIKTSLLLVRILAWPWTLRSAFEPVCQQRPISILGCIPSNRKSQQNSCAADDDRLHQEHALHEILLIFKFVVTVRSYVQHENL